MYGAILHVIPKPTLIEWSMTVYLLFIHLTDNETMWTK